MASRHKSSVIFLERELILSQVWLRLPGTAKSVLLLFFCRRQIEKCGRKGKEKWVHKNNGKIIFPYAEAENKFGFSRTQFRRAIDSLIKHGFIDINHQGGGMKGDATTYFISDRWQSYGTPQFISRARQKDTRGLGFTKNNWEIRTGKKRRTKLSIANVTEASIENVTCNNLVGSSTSDNFVTENL